MDTAVREAAVAATKLEKNKVLAALTSAALGLPGLDSHAATPTTQAEANAQYGYYQESDNRMRVEVYHGDFVIPMSDRLEFTFSVDRDTYSGATPSFSMPEVMANQAKIDQNQNRADVISAASGGVDPTKLAGYQGVMSFKEPFEAYTAIGSQSQQLELNLIQQGTAAITANTDQLLTQYQTANPAPGFPAGWGQTISSAVTIDFQGVNAAVYGKADTNTGGFCPGGAGCYQQNGIVVGTISDPLNPDGHLHRQGTIADREIQYHADSSGIYIRELDGKAFRAANMFFNSLQANGSGVNDVWEILGFNSAVNQNLSTGDGANYANRVAYQQVATNHTGILALDSSFSNINALWIHYKGYIQDVTNSGADFELRVDDINLAPAQFANATPEQIAWLQAYSAYQSSLETASASQRQAIIDNAAAQKAAFEKSALISIYRNFLNQVVPPNTRVKQTFQTQPQETRTQPVFGAKYYFDDATLGVSGGQSNEPDFNSNFGSVNFSQEFNNKLTTVSAGYSYTHNDVTRSSGGHSDHHSQDPGHNPAIYPELDESSESNGFNLGLSQVLNKNALLQLSANYTRQSGYLSNPYKYVYVRGEVTAEEYYEMFNSPETVNWSGITNLEIVGIDLFREVRPNLRNQFSFSTRLNQYIPAVDAALHMDYRYFRDDWGIDSHTMEMKWLQKLPFGLTVTPSLRYYSQSQADFFAPYFLAPRADGMYSSDFRLSGYGALSGGVTVAKQFNRGIKLELGMEYYTHQGNLKLGGGGESDYADFSYWMAHAGLNIALSAPGQIFGGGAGDHHHHHHNHGAPAPAGVMFAHMMNSADDIMVGYRYMYANQSGGMYQGRHAAGDSAVLNYACGTTSCISRPTEMGMHMHMLDLMYAPTDWLNLMLMPQLMDMNMSLEQLPGAVAETAHGSGHESHGLGDTLMVAMVKVFDAPGHHVHAGVGVSAPSGDVDVTLDGRDEPDSELQDYGMQLGSGTWDFKPSLTYTGQIGDWSWGAQLSGTKRLQDRNPSGYALGDMFQATAWGGYSVSTWLSATLRGIYTDQGKIRGAFNRISSSGATVDSPANYGGKFWDVGFGLNLNVPDGAMAGHNFSVEWQQPVADKFNGFQLEREGVLSATWNYAF